MKRSKHAATLNFGRPGQMRNVPYPTEQDTFQTR
jgi:hypothetical protein